MTLQDKFEAALAILREHNDAVGGSANPGYVDPESFIANLKAMGATTEDRLKSLSYEDILDTFPNKVGSGNVGFIKPKLIAKEIAKIFRGKEEVSAQNVSTPRPVTAVRAERMTPRELVESFDPENYDNAVGKVLAGMAKGEAFIVYAQGRSQDVESTLKLLLEVKTGYPGRKDYTVGGVIKAVYCLGELPDNFADENPLYGDRPLRPDGTCDQTGRSWEGVALEIRQLVRVAVDLGEIEVKIDNAHNILDIALSSDAMTKLRSRYRESSLKFDELAAVGNLPTLKIALGEDKKGGNARPFDEGKKVVWGQPPSPVQNYYRAQQVNIAQRGTKTSDVRKK